MFVTFEGTEGAGKSTLIPLVAERLRATGRQVFVTREPGGGDFGEKVRELLLHGGDLEPQTELFLFLADRAEHVARTIRPALSRGETVLCDRFTDSTLVYQGIARGLDLDLVRRLNEMATAGLKPDLTILLDIDPVIGLSRAKGTDRLDREPIEFHLRVREGFISEAKAEPDRWCKIDASQPLPQVLEAALRAVLR